MNLTPLLEASTVVQIHVAFAFGAIATIFAIFIAPKGSKTRKMMGRAWVIAMSMVALSSFGINDINQFMGFSWIHLLSLFTLWGCYMGVRTIRRGDLRGHKNAMLGTAIGGLVIAGGFTFLPGRLMHDVFFAGLFG